MRRLMGTLVAIVVACGGGGSSSTTSTTESASNRTPDDPLITTGDEVVPPPEVANLAGAAEAPPDAELPEDTTPLASRMAPRRLHIPTTYAGKTSRFTFDGFRRGWMARLPNGRQHLLTPLYGEGKVYLGGGFSSHQLFAYDARSGERSWTASAPDGGPSAAILEDDKILFNTESCTLFAVDAKTGRRIWSRWLGDPLMSQPSAANGYVFSGHLIDGESPGGIAPGTTGWGTGSGRRYGFTAMNLRNGAPRWTRRISADVMNAAVLDDEAAYFTTMDGVVWKMDQRTGRVRWRRRLHATSAPWLDGEKLHLTVRERGERRERAIVLAKGSGETLAERDPVDAAFLRRPDTSVQAGWAYEGSRATIADGRVYQTIGNEVHSRDAESGRLLWKRQYTGETNARPASPPAIAGSQLVFGTREGVLFGLDIDTGMTTWAYDVGEPIAAQPTVAHGWVYAATTRGGLVALEVSDASFDGWHMWGGNARHNGPVGGTEAPEEEDERPSEGTLRLDESARDDEIAGFPLQNTKVEAEVSGFVARVRVEQTFTNPYERPVEAVYLFPLPDDAAVDAMELRAGDRVVHARIRRRQEAQEEYRNARDRGVLASLLEQERPNLFKQSVANIKPGDEIRIVLHYTQALAYEGGAYRFTYPLVAGPRYQAEGDGESEGTRQVVLAPGAERPDRVEIGIRADFGLEVREVSSPTHEVDVERDGRKLSVGLASPARPDRDFEARFAVAGAMPTVSVLANPPANAVAGNLSMAIHPRLDVPDDEVMPRELVFVVDTSSSMHGRPLALAQAAMLRALDGLRPTDTFRILKFSDGASALSEEALEATPENIGRGKTFVREMRALGATEMIPGLRAALEPEAEDGRMRFVLLMTDGYIGDERPVFRAVNEHLGHARLFGFGVGSAVNRYLLTRVAEVGRGDVQVVTLDESPEVAADAFHERIARPYLTDVSIDWGDLQIADAYPRRLPDLFADRPLVVHARYAHAGEGEVTIRGRVGGRPFSQKVHVALPAQGNARPELASVWARTRIRDLMTAMALRPNDTLKEEVVQLGLRHHLLTEWTAFVAIDEGYRVDRPATTRVQQPSGLPAGVERPQTRTATQRATPSPTPNELALPEAAAEVSVTAPPPMPVRRMRRRARRPTGLRGGVGSSVMMSASRSLGAPSSTAYQRCLAQARRPDGTIDQAALRACLQRAQEMPFKAGALMPKPGPEAPGPSRQSPPAAHPHRAVPPSPPPDLRSDPR